MMLSNEKIAVYLKALPALKNSGTALVGLCPHCERGELRIIELATGKIEETCTEGCRPDQIRDAVRVILGAGRSPKNGAKPEPDPLRAVSARPWTSAEALMAKDIPPLRWIVPGIIPEGLTILAGRPKQGKSWGVYGLGVAVATGGKAFGEKQVEAGDVLYLALEDGERRLKERLGIILRGASIPKRFDWAIEWPKLGGRGYVETPENPDCRSQILWWLDEHPEARLVAIDTLARVKPRTQKTGNAYEQDYSAMEPLQQIAVERRIALVLVTHTRKPVKAVAAGDVFDEIMDSTGITGGADTMLVLKKTRAENELSLWVTGRDVDDQELLIKWDPDTSDWKLLGPAETTRLSALRKSILDCLNRSGDVMTTAEVAARIGRDTPEDRASVKTTMYRMADGALLLSVGSGRFKRNPPTGF